MTDTRFLPVHQFTGLHALAVLPSGRPVWPVYGGAEDDENGGKDAAEDDDTEPDDEPDGEQDGDKQLGPKGEKALQAEKDKRKALQSDLRDYKALGKSPAEIAELIAAAGKSDGNDGGSDADQIRAEAKAEAAKEVLRDRVLDKIEAKARKFSDPEDAAALLLRGRKVEEFLDGEKIDAEAIDEALGELLENKPYLAAQSGKRFSGSGDGGARPTKPARSQSIEEAVSRAYSR